jgi:hypothetical protein
VINLRYHIVSITAVFLALGIGVALGSTLIERATVDTLETRLDEQEQRLDETDGENARLRAELERRDALDDQLADVGPPRLLAGHLTDVAVTVLAVDGTDEAAVAEVRDALGAADAAVRGTLWFTDRWADLDDAAATELRDLLGLGITDADTAAQLALRRLSLELAEAGEPEPEPEPEAAPAPVPTTAAPPPVEPGADPADPDPATGEPGTTTTPAAPTTTTTTAPPERGELVEALVAAGFLRFEPDAADTPLADWEGRYVVVSADDDVAEVPADTAVLPLLTGLADADGAPTTVVAGLASPIDPSAPLDGEPDTGASDDPAVDPVLVVRADEDLAVRVSTVDHALGFDGLAAVVLAVEDLGVPRVGHYGTAPSAGALLPPALP